MTFKESRASQMIPIRAEPEKTRDMHGHGLMDGSGGARTGPALREEMASDDWGNH